MPQPTDPGRLDQLVRSLQQAMERLAEGQLDLAALDACTADARAIYERLVVLRHKAREAQVAAAKQPGPPLPHPVPGAPDATPAIRLDTRPQESPVHQTSLIDAIAETEASAQPPTAKKPKPKTAPPTAPQAAAPAPKAGQAAVGDLRKVIALSQKFWFVAELFANDRKRYEEAIDAINAMGGLQEAEAYMQDEIIAKLPKPPGEEVAITFKELLQRRYSA